MSNWGIGLLFGFGPGARPEVLFIVDAEAHCPRCGFEVIVRRYDAAPFHSLTVARLRGLLETEPTGVNGNCSQCDAAVGDGDVVRWIVHYGFPSGRGLVQGFADRDGTRRWLLSPHEAMDVQLVPRWDQPGDQSRVEVATLTGGAIREVFGRALNAKEEARGFAAGAVQPGAALLLGQGLMVTAVASGQLPSGGGAASVGQLPSGGRELPSGGSGALDLAVAAGMVGSLVAEPLVVGAEATAGFPGAAAEWLTGVELETGVDIWGVADRNAVVEAARRIPEGFPIRVQFEGDDDAEELALVVPDDASSPPSPTLDVVGVAREAARAMLNPGDATRLEIDRMLHGLTGLWTGDESTPTETDDPDDLA